MKVLISVTLKCLVTLDAQSLTVKTSVRHKLREDVPRACVLDFGGSWDSYFLLAESRITTAAIRALGCRCTRCFTEGDVEPQSVGARLDSVFSGEQGGTEDHGEHLEGQKAIPDSAE
ncbi:hypothetical protein OSB04_019448 [Centaurea solstitialis]|uniref:Uncharacterized protein n=1 Tax=Centaurea solstitialis TaxID=347529 RepID=A0AA38WCE4_9ASTR|nr:hypothetical protein OSB04_019448 [Centaurea solstitialis]